MGGFGQNKADMSDRSSIELKKEQWEVIADCVEQLDDLVRAEKADRDAWLKAVTRLRTQVLETQLQPMARAVEMAETLCQQLSLDLKRPLRFSSSGPVLWVDGRVREALSTALVHSVRNTIEHGFEWTTNGKASRIQVEFGMDGAHLFVKVEDDGPGLSGSWIQSVKDSGDDPFERIFQPGFTSRPQANDISGRGIGLDAVRASIASVDGLVRAYPVQPRGFGLSISIPLEVMALEAVEVRIAGESLWFPANQVDVVPRPHPEEDLSDSSGAYQAMGTAVPEHHVYIRLSSAAHGWNRVFAVDSVGRPRMRTFRPLDPSWHWVGPPFMRRWFELSEGRVLGARREEGSRDMIPLADPTTWLSLVQDSRPSSETAGSL